MQQWKKSIKRRFYRNRPAAHDNGANRCRFEAEKKEYPKQVIRFCRTISVDKWQLESAPTQEDRDVKQRCDAKEATEQKVPRFVPLPSACVHRKKQGESANSIKELHPR